MNAEPLLNRIARVFAEQGLQLDFMAHLHGIRSYESLRSRAVRIVFDEHDLLIASLADIITSKRATGRSRDLAVLPILEKTLEEKNERNNKKTGQRGRPEKGK